MNTFLEVKSSYFDEINEDENDIFNNFVVDPLSELSNYFPIMTKDVLVEGHAFKVRDGDKKPVKRYYKLFINRLECFKDEAKSKTLYFLMLSGVTVEFAKIGKDATNMTYLAKMVKNKIPYTLMFENETEFVSWKTELSKVCILKNFNHRFYNIKTIGSGSFAKVFLSVRDSDKEQLAVKTFDKRKLSKSPNPIRTKQAILKEITILRLIENPNVIELLEVYEGREKIYFVMELLKGGSLLDYIIKKYDITEEDCKRIMVQLLNSLIYIHSLDIMHRDLKPENILFRTENYDQVVISDFGLAEFSKNKKYIYTRCGTPGYVAPEVLNDLKYNTKVDVYSAGIILFILLTGSSPFYDEVLDNVIRLNKSGMVNVNVKSKRVQLTSKSQNILQTMLLINQEFRPSAKDIMKAEWFRTESQMGIEFEPDNNLMEIEKSELKEKILNHNEMNKYEVNKLRKDEDWEIKTPLLHGKTDSIDSPSKVYNSPLKHYSASPIDKSKYKKYRNGSVEQNILISDIIQEEDNNSMEEEEEKEAKPHEKMQGMKGKLPKLLTKH